jgi:hypothetical protein
MLVINSAALEHLQAGIEAQPRRLPHRRHSGAAQRNPESRVVTEADMRGARAPVWGAGALDSGFRCAAPE